MNYEDEPADQPDLMAKKFISMDRRAVLNKKDVLERQYQDKMDKSLN